VYDCRPMCVLNCMSCCHYGVKNIIKHKVKNSPYSITERRVPELIPVLDSQPAGNVSHKPGGRLPDTMGESSLRKTLPDSVSTAI